MSKAFTRERDDGDETDPLDEEEPWPLPAGTKNYMTPSGARAIQAELDEKRAAFSIMTEPRARRRLERRMRALERRLAEGEVVDPRAQPRDRVLFGSRVVARQESGEEQTVWIVGVDQASPPEGRVSWRSAMARALLGARPGNVVTVRAPAGDRRLEVVRIEPPDAD